MSTLTTTSDASVSGNLSVGANTEIGGSTTINGDLTVNGSIYGYQELDTGMELNYVLVSLFHFLFLFLLLGLLYVVG